ncbi:MAG TPA: hypothetical protein VMA30_17080 [Xanthobacteraceae bacterium]|nr:hypothetical protein [Xanthobacteraceae bacterium]
MKSLNTKLALSAVAIAMLATPAFAQRQHQRVQYDRLQDYAGSDVYQGASPLHYPDFSAGRTGSLESQESGAQFSLGR